MSATELLIIIHAAWSGWQARNWWAAEPGTVDRWLSGIMAAMLAGCALMWAVTP